MSLIQGNYGNLQSANFPSPDTVITILNPSDDSKTINVKAIFDPAAVMTCLPEQEIEALGSLNYSSVIVRGVNNTVIKRKTYVVDIQLGDDIFSNIEVIAVPKNYGLIGRDILNLKKVAFDGPRGQWIYDCQKNCTISDEEE